MNITSTKDEERGVYVFSTADSEITLPIDFVEYWGFELQPWIENQLGGSA
jgi:hypothetical protein